MKTQEYLEAQEILRLMTINNFEIISEIYGEEIADALWCDMVEVMQDEDLSEKEQRIKEELEKIFDKNPETIFDLIKELSKICEFVK